MTMLVVGISGHIGSRVAARAAERGLPVVGLAREPAPHVEPFAKVHLGDARRADLGLPPETARELAAEVTSLVLTAGSFDLSLSLADAQARHIAPLRGALRFARDCPGLRTVVVVSSLLALGDTRERMRSDLVPGAARHRNFYEWAKLHGEQIARASGLPVDIVRAGHVVVSEPTEGRRGAPQALFELLRLMAAGWPLAVAGDNRYWCAPADFAADVVLDRAQHGTGGSSVWAVDPASPTNAEIFDLVNARYGLRVKRVRNAALARTVAAVLRPRWLDLPMNREVLDYCTAHWDLDLRCLTTLIAAGRLSPPPDRDYLVRSLDVEFERLRGQLP
ncbi:NAD-dependent epimerase/dehydratase family protein [Streptomyces sp. 4N509B]|uniref:NAD-dependent epimerase/dehydratase family protein n=1 Tax=Streptomyces sp. 4N509B TaxID=3457413 RepID=UPI003FCF25DA